MCVVIRTYLDTRFFPIGGVKGGTRRHADASDEACTGIHVTQRLPHTGPRYRMSRNISLVCATGHVHAYWNSRGSSVRFVIPICGIYRERGWNAVPMCASVSSLLEPFNHLRVNSNAPIGCTSQEKKTFVGKKTWLASPMIDTAVVLVYE